MSLCESAYAGATTLLFPRDIMKPTAKSRIPPTLTHTPTRIFAFLPGHSHSSSSEEKKGKLNVGVGAGSTGVGNGAGGSSPWIGVTAAVFTWLDTVSIVDEIAVVVVAALYVSAVIVPELSCPVVSFITVCETIVDSASLRRRSVPVKPSAASCATTELRFDVAVATRSMFATRVAGRVAPPNVAVAASVKTAAMTVGLTTSMGVFAAAEVVTKVVSAEKICAAAVAEVAVVAPPMSAMPWTTMALTCASFVSIATPSGVSPAKIAS